MQLAYSIFDLRQALSSLGPCALVPTMGNLHAGHLRLVEQGRSLGLPVVVSIFVNRLQFAPHEDFDRYPRTLEHDCKQLEEAGCALVFAPQEKQLYPQPQLCRVQASPPLATILEGEFRPGFFNGVCTVVLKLFNCVQPQVALFGKKDYQQLKVIDNMVQQLALPITVVGVDTVRSPDGLALSSRNQYLSETQRVQANDLQLALHSLIAKWQNAWQQVSNQNSLDWPTMLSMASKQVMNFLVQKKWQPDYICLRRRDDLQEPTEQDGPGTLVALAAARLGSTRLIDSIEC